MRCGTRIDFESDHAFSCMAVFCDGSIRFHRDSMAIEFWQTAGSRNGQEVVSSEDRLGTRNTEDFKVERNLSVANVFGKLDPPSFWCRYIRQPFCKSNVGRGDLFFKRIWMIGCSLWIGIFT